MKLIYLYTNLNWYRLSLFKSISKIMDVHVVILNGYEVGYQGVEYKPDYQGLNITFLSEEDSHFSKLTSILDQENFDGIVVPSMNSAFYLDLTTRLSHYYHKKGKTVLYFWEYWPMDVGKESISKWFKQQIRHIYTRLNRRSIDYFITPSMNTYSFYQRMNIPSEKLIRCWNVSEVEECEADIQIIRNELGIPNDHKIVLVFGRLESYKGAAELITCFSKLQNQKWHLLICGPGSETVQPLANNAPNIHFVGSVKPENRAMYYSAANLFVLANTYKGKVEPWGLTVNEAMSFSLPILATNATGSAIDLVFSGINGYVIDASKLEKELPYYIEKILSDDELEKIFGKNSKMIISNYTFDHMAEAFKAAVEKGLIQ